MKLPPWQPGLAWAYHLLQEARAERDRLRRTLRHRLGRAVLDLPRRPWRVPSVLRVLVDAARGRRAPVGPPTLAPPRPDPPDAGAEPSSDPAARAVYAELEACCRDLVDLVLSPEYRLGTSLVEGGLAREGWAVLQRPGARCEGQPSAAPLVPRARPFPPPEPEPLAAACRCLGPAWWVRMLALEGVREVGGRPTGDVLVGLAGGGPAGWHATVADARRVVAWVLDDHLPSRTALDALKRCHRVFVAAPSLLAPLRERVSVPVEALAPAIQPRLDNPIGWWSGHPELAVPARDAHPRPPAWEALGRVARGLALGSASEAIVTAALGAELPGATAPSWADRELASEMRRFVRLRAAQTDHALATRLEAVAGALDLANAAGEAGRVTVAFASNRAERRPRLLSLLARQSWPDLTVVGVLHGDERPAESLAAMARQAEALGLRARFHTVPGSATLGECLQHAFDDAEGAAIVRVDDDDWYGAHYVHDMVMALAFSEAGIAYKHSVIMRDVESARTFLLASGWEYLYANHVTGGGRMAMRRDLASALPWRDMPNRQDAILAFDAMACGVPLLVADRFNHVFNRGGVTGHTWKARLRRVLAQGNARPLPAAARPEDFDI